MQRGSDERVTLPMLTVDWSLPLPGVDVHLVMPPQGYVRAINQTAGLVAVTCVLGESDEKTNGFEIENPITKNKNWLSRLCAVAVIKDENAILRPDHVAASLIGWGFMLADNMQLDGYNYGSARGQMFHLVPVSVDEEAVANKVDYIKRVYEETVRPFMHSLALLKQVSPAPSARLFEVNAVDYSDALFNLALNKYKEKDYLSFAGYLWLTFTPLVEGAKADMLKALISHVQPYDSGLYGITLNDYVLGACQFATMLLTYIQEMNNLLNSIRMEEENATRVNALRRMRAKLDELFKEASGEEDVSDIGRIKKILQTKQLPENVRAYITKELNKLESPYALHWAETEVLLKHITFLLELPWCERAEEVVPFHEVESYLHSKLYGLRKAKEAVLDYLAALHRSQGSAVKGTVLCFVGPPGTGKTDMARRIAEALKRPFYKISLGGVNDEAEIRGHRRTYVGALPGNIMKALAQVKVKNPVILLDEIDKLVVGVRGDPAAALMEVLDPEFNREFYDHFVDFPFDLSEVLFICAANVLDNIHPALRDRLNVVEFRPYTPKEKFNIARDYIIPKVAGELLLEQGETVITDDAIWHIINFYTYESGVRELYRITKKLLTRNLRRAYKVITPREVDDILWDEPKMVWKRKKHTDLGNVVGVAPILGVASQTGEGVIDTIMFRPLHAIEGNEDKVHITYNTDDLGKRTIQMIIECARDYYEGEAPRYMWLVHQTNPTAHSIGTSHGVSSTLAVLSALYGKPLHPDYIYTGEVDVFGNIHAVGGIATKIATAESAGYKRIYIPKENEHDLAAMDFVPEIEIKLVSHIRELLTEGVFVNGD